MTLTIPLPTIDHMLWFSGGVCVGTVVLTVLLGLAVSRIDPFGHR